MKDGLGRMCQSVCSTSLTLDWTKAGSNKLQFPCLQLLHCFIRSSNTACPVRPMDSKRCLSLLARKLVETFDLGRNRQVQARSSMRKQTQWQQPSRPPYIVRRKSTCVKMSKELDGAIQVIMLTGIVSIGTIVRATRLGAEECF